MSERRPTLLVAEDRDAIVGRLRAVDPAGVPRWGTLTAPRMLCHVSDQLRLALGELSCRRFDTLFSRTAMKWLVVSTGFEPPPGKVRTMPELLSTVPTTWAADLATCERLIGDVGKGTAWAVHPFFGPLDGREWGRLAWKHLDHHLRQFGV